MNRLVAVICQGRLAIRWHPFQLARPKCILHRSRNNKQEGKTHEKASLNRIGGGGLDLGGGATFGCSTVLQRWVRISGLLLLRILPLWVLLSVPLLHLLSAIL